MPTKRIACLQLGHGCHARCSCCCSGCRVMAAAYRGVAEPAHSPMQLTRCPMVGGLSEVAPPQRLARIGQGALRDTGVPRCGSRDSGRRPRDRFPIRARSSRCCRGTRTTAFPTKMVMTESRMRQTMASHEYLTTLVAPHATHVKCLVSALVACSSGSMRTSRIGPPHAVHPGLVRSDDCSARSVGCMAPSVRRRERKLLSVTDA